MFGNSHDNAHIMLYKYNGNVQFISQTADEMCGFNCLSGIHTGGRFVEQYQLGSAGERPSDFQASLIAVRQVLGNHIALAFEADEAQ